MQFRTAPDLAPLLRKVIEIPRRLPRVAMETLAIIAYHQPVTRPEIEEIRGASLSQQTLDSLLEADLVAPKGRRESPGRPTLWGTTPHFLAQFGLKDLRELPRREDLLLEPLSWPPRSHHLIPPAKGRLWRLTRGVGRRSWKRGSRNSRSSWRRVVEERPPPLATDH